MAVQIEGNLKGIVCALIPESKSVVVALKDIGQISCAFAVPLVYEQFRLGVEVLVTPTQVTNEAGTRKSEEYLLVSIIGSSLRN